MDAADEILFDMNGRRLGVEALAGWEVVVVCDGRMQSPVAGRHVSALGRLVMAQARAGNHHSVPRT